MAPHYKATRHVEHQELNDIAGCNIFGRARWVEFLLSLDLREQALREVTALAEAVRPPDLLRPPDPVSGRAATNVFGRIRCARDYLECGDVIAAQKELRWLERFVGVPQREADPWLRRVRWAIEASRGTPWGQGGSAPPWDPPA